MTLHELTVVDSYAMYLVYGDDDGVDLQAPNDAERAEIRTYLAARKLPPPGAWEATHATDFTRCDICRLRGDCVLVTAVSR